MPVNCEGKVSEVTLRFTAGASPVPARLMSCGLPGELSAIVMAAVRVPPAVGSNFTDMAQLWPEPRELPHELDSMKSPGFAPVTPILVKFRAALPVLEIVTDCDGAEEPTGVATKLRFAADSVRKGPFKPVPVSGITCGLLAVVSVRVSIPDRVPVTDGEN